jgi:phosphate transport system permease protein
MVPLVWILWTVVSKGAGLLGSLDWWTNSQAGITPAAPGGGAYHALLGTLLMSFVTMIIAVPVAVFTAIYLTSTAVGASPASSASWSTS